jgi:hypothetical protein
MRVAVVTPYFREPLDWLRQCHASVRAQTHACTHVMVADGHPQSEVAGWPGLRHIALPTSHGDYGDTPRAIGSIEAIGAGFDAIAYLDADNAYAPDHIESLVELQRRTGAAFRSWPSASTATARLLPTPIACSSAGRPSGWWRPGC